MDNGSAIECTHWTTLDYFTQCSMSTSAIKVS